MNKLAKLLLVFFYVFLMTAFASLISKSESKENNLPVITVINLVRSNELGHEKDNLFESLKAQYKVTSDAKVNATWLLQYSVLEDEQIINFAKNKMPNQEFGLLFEIDRNFTKKSGVLYRGQGPSYFSDGLFLVSYDINERRKLIDEAFSKFKDIFGYYPKTVGAWWIGGDSLTYMQEKYGIVAALRASDQFDLDVYSIWGTPWSIPYLASRENEGIPAGSFDESSKVVILQWAARDPLRGYEDPLFSIQDYSIKQYDTTYVDHLASTFLKTPNDNLVFGLENGGSLSIFEKYYKTMLSQAKKLEKNSRANILLAKDFANDFLLQKQVFSKNYYFLHKDYKSNDQAFWINTKNYRARIEKLGNNIYLSDLRDYREKAKEDFSLLPNSQGNLRVNESSIIDSLRNPKERLLIATSSGLLRISGKNPITLFAKNIKIADFTDNTIQLPPIQKTYNFSANPLYIDAFEILVIVFLIYFTLLYLLNKNLVHTINTGFITFIPLVIAYPFLTKGSINGLSFMFDKKMLLIINLFPSISFGSIQNTLVGLQVIPFLIILLMHFIFVIMLSKKYRIIFYSYIVVLIFIFAHIPYFPLDRSTYLFVFVVFAFFCLTLYFLNFAIFVKTKSKRIFMFVFSAVSLIILILGVTTLLSRTKQVITPFEVDALQLIKNEKKDILFVKQDTVINPIYKAIKPVLYDDYSFAEKLTNTKWTTVIRPQNHVLNISNFQNKLIFVPRYLGGDLSPYEQNKLGLNKIFDNSQIAIYKSK